jgi:crotonobetainyl-CoA:carnitine CoA-transferase CaiB-like acyl-CoA transferase
MLLADMGADVIKVEPPSGDVSRQWGPFPNQAMSSPEYGGYFASINRNKRSVILDLKSESDSERLWELIAGADVLVENFRSGVMDRFGFSYEEVHQRHPRLVYACIRGFGDPRTGASPYDEWPAFDIIAQAMGGILGVTGSDADHPVKVGPGIGDIFPAALAATGILAAVRHAEHTGQGQFVDVGMYDAVLSLTERIVYQYSLTGIDPAPQGNTHPLLCPYGVVATGDGFVAVAAPTDHHWRILADIMGRPELAHDPDFATNNSRLANSERTYAAVEQWSRNVSTASVVEALAGRIPCGPVNRASDIVADPHVAAREMVVTVEHPDGGQVQIVGSPIKFSETRASQVMRAPRRGEHMDAAWLPRTDELTRAAE